MPNSDSDVETDPSDWARPRHVYDWIVVGAGSAGCVLASRLSENPDVSVLLVEAGPESLSDESRVPAAWPSLIGSSADWGTTTTTVPFTGVSYSYARGFGLGGSSAINGMTHLRGHRSRYDAWAEAGLSDWGFGELLPYFCASENKTSGGADLGLRGGSGPMQVQPPAPAPPIAQALLSGADELNLPRAKDISAGIETGFGLPDVNIVDGLRQSAADAYLTPARHRPNLVVEADAHVLRLTFTGKRCTGIWYSKDGATREALVKPNGSDRPGGEVVLSGGAIGTPHLLLLSGIGPADHLQAKGIPLLVDAPLVGQNLQDHPMTGIAWKSADAIPPTPFQHSEAMGLVPSTPNGEPDLHILSVDVPWVPANVTPPAHGYSINVSLMTPHSRGTVRLHTASAHDAPEVNPNYLDDPRDRAALVAGLRLARRLGETAGFDNWRDGEFLPGADVTDDDGLLEHARKTIGPYFHATGTCAMGDNADSVVDPHLRVRGVDALRVVDASIIPSIPSGNTNATVLAIAEKAAAMFMTSDLGGTRRAAAPPDAFRRNDEVLQK